MFIRRLFFLVLICGLHACSNRVRFSPGEIPPPQTPSPQESAEGKKLANLFASSFYRTPNKDIEKAVIRVGTRLITASDNSKDKWTIFVFTHPQFANAAVTKGKFIFVWDGLFANLKSDDELAAVLSHEIGHYLANHQVKDGLESATTSFVNGAGRLADASFKHPQGNTSGLGTAALGLTSTLVAYTTQKLFVQPEQHRKELEADMIGIFLMAHAGYNPEKAVELWTRLEKLEPGGGFFSTHPAGSERLEKLQELLPLAEPLYKASPLSQIK